MTIRVFSCELVRPSTGGCIPSLSPVFIPPLTFSGSSHLEVVFRDRKVVLVGNSRRVAQPLPMNSAGPKTEQEVPHAEIDVLC